MKSSERRPQQDSHRLSPIYMLPSPPDSVQLARPHPFPSSRSMSSCCGHAHALQDGERSSPTPTASTPPLKMGAPGLATRHHVLHRFPGAETERSLHICPTNRGRGRTQLVGNHTARTSTIRRKISKSGAPAKYGRCAASTRSGSNTRPKVRRHVWNDIPTCKEQAWTSNI